MNTMSDAERRFAEWMQLESGYKQLPLPEAIPAAIRRLELMRDMDLNIAGLRERTRLLVAWLSAGRDVKALVAAAGKTLNKCSENELIALWKMLETKAEEAHHGD